MFKKVIFCISLPAILGWVVTFKANAAEDDSTSTTGSRKKNESALQPIEIHSGFFIFEGQYIPPPYSVNSKEGSVYVNGYRVSHRRPGTFFRRSLNSYQPDRWPQKRGAAQIEEHLRLNGLLFCKENGPAVIVSPEHAVSVLEILSSSESAEAKVQQLLDTDNKGISSIRWAALAETFVGTPALLDRLLALRQHQAELLNDDTEFQTHWFVNSALTLSGFVLAVWALGTLISCRPPTLLNSRAKVISRASCRRVIWLIVLIAVLNVYDLLCTLIAGSMGGIWELNPFASPIIHQNSSVVIFKLGITVGAVILLLVARRHRLAQVGSWWAGVLYTVLILRWSTFNTMFL